jgi:hypothetical protein
MLYDNYNLSEGVDNDNIFQAGTNELETIEMVVRAESRSVSVDQDFCRYIAFKDEYGTEGVHDVKKCHKHHFDALIVIFYESKLAITTI